jgi:predicted alpha/beta hydrolase family esterase
VRTSPLWISTFLIPDLGYVPVGARTEPLSDVSVPSSISCSKIEVRSEPDVTLSGLLLLNKSNVSSGVSPKSVVIYFQGEQAILSLFISFSLLPSGNAGNTLHRIPKFSSLLSALPSSAVIAIAPRSYWMSTRRSPTQAGITADYAHAIGYAALRFPNVPLVVYGHSLGGSIAACVLATGEYPHVRGAILENPFASVPSMVSALYSQRWLPYHYMGPLVWDRWDATNAAANPQPNSAFARIRNNVLVVVSEHDELVPPDMGRRIAQESGGRVSIIRGALHEDAWTKRQWKEEMARYIRMVEVRGLPVQHIVA